VENGHLGNQTQKIDPGQRNLKKKQRLLSSRERETSDPISTSTSKDYFLQPFKVNFAGFSQESSIRTDGVKKEKWPEDNSVSRH
jgi:hypothetical protein